MAQISLYCYNCPDYGDNRMSDSADNRQKETAFASYYKVEGNGVIREESLSKNKAFRKHVSSMLKAVDIEILKKTST